MELLKQYNIVGLDIQELQHKVWLIDHSYILKAYENQAECMKNLQIYQALRQYGIPIPEVVPTGKGESFIINDNTHYILTRKLRGTPLSKEEVINNPKLAFLVGKTVGRLHRAFAEITGLLQMTDNDFVNEMRGWIRQNIHEHTAGSFTHEIYEDCTAELDKVYDRLDRHLIHRDLHLGNLLFDGNELSGYIDFDISQVNARIFDIAYLCAGWAIEQVGDAEFMTAWKKALRAVISGYQEELPLSAPEIDSLGLMMCCIEILFVAYFSSVNDRINAFTAEESLKWLWKNRNNLINKE
jgi:Ser/Thr protein kinase RdoA (MazF antagonist)